MYKPKTMMTIFIRGRGGLDCGYIYSSYIPFHSQTDMIMSSGKSEWVLIINDHVSLFSSFNSYSFITLKSWSDNNLWRQWINTEKDKTQLNNCRIVECRNLELILLRSKGHQNNGLISSLQLYPNMPKLCFETLSKS